MDEAEKYQQRLQAIAEKRRMKEDEEKVKREMEEELLKHAQDKITWSIPKGMLETWRKYLREQWLMEATPSTPEDPKLQSGIPASQTTEQSAEETQSAERQMKKEEEKTEIINDESSQTGENEPSILSVDNTEKPMQAYLEEYDRNVIEVLEVEVERNQVSEAAQEDTEEKRKAKTEEQETNQLTMDTVEPVDLPCQSLEQIKTPDETHFSLADIKTELIMAENNPEDEEWEMVNCCPEEDLDLVLTSDLIQVQSDSGLDQKSDEVLKVEQVFIMDKEEDLEVGASEVLSLVAEKKSDLEDTSCEKPPECAFQNTFLEKVAHAGTSAPSQELSNVSGIIFEESSVFSVECNQNMPHLPAYTTHAVEEILGDNTENKENQRIATSSIVKGEWKKASGAEDEVHQYIPIDREREKSPSLKQREMAAHSTEQESEIQTLMPPGGTPAGAETVTSTKRKTCQCCTVM
ncbi:hypothetical protein QTP70_024125 [Hemibagrus guttatus]|uniref:Paralemmin-3 n=1 Tax=Hemibagrus guttatus TaxID=175788 RepID=A0AAE0QH17_9TELE|nr:hypothetical protein QTP70_024125 [Hemibagrus guttatus]